MSKICIVIPAHNEAPVIAEVIQDVQRQGYGHVVVVDDGSTDDTGRRAREAGALVIAHRLNRGKGAAIKTGFSAAQLLRPDVVVAMDGDGQHRARDIAELIRPIQENRADVVLGTRQWESSDIPRQKVWQNMIGNATTWLFHRQWVNDSQSGFRAYSRHALEVIDTQADFYDYDSEVIREIRTHRLPFAQVPISVRYTPYTQTKSTRQSLGSGLKTVARMIWQQLH